MNPASLMIYIIGIIISIYILSKALFVLTIIIRAIIIRFFKRNNSYSELGILYEKGTTKIHYLTAIIIYIGFITILFSTISTKTSNDRKGPILISSRGKLYEQASVAEKILETLERNKTHESTNSPNLDPEYTNQLTKGKIAHNIRDSMQVGIEYTVIVTITKSLSDSILFLGLKPSKFRKDIKLTSSDMKVSLTDPSRTKDKFAIVPFSDVDTKLVHTNTNTTWKWHVTPLEGGKNILVLMAYAKIKSGSGVTPEEIPVYIKEISVESSPLFTLKEFFLNHWIGIFTALLIAFILWLIRYSKEWIQEKIKPIRSTIGFTKSSNEP